MYPSESAMNLTSPVFQALSLTKNELMAIETAEALVSAWNVVTEESDFISTPDYADCQSGCTAECENVCGVVCQDDCENTCYSGED